MDVTPELVKKVAENARLVLTPEEVKRFQKELAEMFDKFAILQQADTKNTKPSFHPIDIKNVTRKDEVGKCLDRDEALALTKHKTDKYFKGPKVI